MDYAATHNQACCVSYVTQTRSPLEYVHELLPVNQSNEFSYVDTTAAIVLNILIYINNCMLTTYICMYKENGDTEQQNSGQGEGGLPPVLFNLPHS